MNIIKHCLFCGGNEKLLQLYPRNFRDAALTPEIFSARRVTEHFHYETVRCQNCGLVFAREIIPAMQLSKLYGQSQVTYGEYSGIIADDYWRHLSPYLKDIKKGAALEVGCGSGFFLERLIKAGFKEVSGCEPSQAAKAEAPLAVRDNIRTEMFGPGLYPDNYFDLVCSFQTLDHLSEPHEAAKNCYALTRPGGLAYFIVHDVESLQAKLLKDRSPIIDVEHVYLFNKNTLSRLFNEAGFKVIKVGDVVSTYPVSYWLRMLSLGKMAEWLNSIGIGKLRLPLKAGNIYIIAKR
jgi:SAM-dependent methyltransferase